MTQRGYLFSCISSPTLGVTLELAKAFLRLSKKTAKTKINAAVSIMSRRLHKSLCNRYSVNYSSFDFPLVTSKIKSIVSKTNK